MTAPEILPQILFNRYGEISDSIAPLGGSAVRRYNPVEATALRKSGPCYAPISWEKPLNLIKKACCFLPYS
jgi:hypothetical protein